MNEIFDFLFSQYKDYSTPFIVLEIIATIFGALSVVFSARNSILVYPTGLVSTALYVYLLYVGSLYGDMIINGYYFYMSIYGWWLWSRKDKQDGGTLKISKMQSKDNIVCLLIFMGSVIFVSSIYIYFDKFTYWWAYVDTFITGLFFIGMWLLAKRKLENWLFLIVGDIIAIPLFFLKGYTFTSMLSIFLTIVAFIGYFSWKKTLQNNPTTL
ncbi:nicotinamide riboside transporter PnuC [Flavobacterium litorale]|uniref:Nicotinamide riboside transporter PnuC n=1 Tax=Flavobacterium litorale TaxID=2856519 RepID=A0ABX8VCW1_9FLAO|nr:nicotinamide riboside transporter PnuC [Flavobacterium litorale]QYJ68680.1 nicotinamide riboside transporter PnuC [Flavobacterium litorale]